jgi:AraC family transcriptional regulator
VKIAITDRLPTRVAYLRYTGPFGEPLRRFWRATVTPWLADHGLVDCPRFGVALDDPHGTAPERCRYNACVELPPGLRLPDAEEALIPGGRYAITTFKGTGSEIGAAWDAFVHEAVGAGSHIDPQRHPFERYPRGAVFDARTGSFSCELCLPLAG